MKVYTVRPYPDAPVEIFFSKENAEKYAEHFENEWAPMGIIVREHDTRDEPCSSN